MLLHIFLTGQFIQSHLFEHGKYFIPKKKLINYVFAKEDTWQNLITYAAQQQFYQRQTSGNK